MDIEYLRKLDLGEIKGSVIQKAGHAWINVDRDDVVIHEGDGRQSARFWIRKKFIENDFTLSPEDKENLIWLPTSVREELLEKWHRKRQDLIAYCMSRITASEKDVKRILGNDF